MREKEKMNKKINSELEEMRVGYLNKLHDYYFFATF